MDLYHINLKNLRRFYKFTRFKRILWIFKNTIKIIRVSEKKTIRNDEVCIKKIYPI